MSGTVDRIIGYRPQLWPAAWYLPYEKEVLLVKALEHLAYRTMVHTGLLRGIVGVWIFGALLNRDFLSIPSHVFRFMDAHEDRWARWWRGARLEVLAMARVVPLLSAHIGDKLCPLMFACDAMGASQADAGGFGVVAAAVPSSTIADCFSQGACIARTVARLDGSLSGLRRPDRALRPTLPRSSLPRQLFDGSTEWVTLAQGRWLYEDHITLGEGRAVLRLLQMLTRDVNFHESICMSLEDNQPVAGSMTKGRSQAPALNFLLRRRCALCGAARIKLLLPWVESLLMPADGVSRIIDSAGGTAPFR